MLLFWIILQTLLSIYVVLMVQLFNTKTMNFITIDMYQFNLYSNFDAALTWNYLTIYFLGPLFVLCVLYASSAGRKINFWYNNKPFSFRDITGEEDAHH